MLALYEELRRNLVVRSGRRSKVRSILMLAVAGKEFESVERFREADEQSWREANQLLEKFDLLRLYYGEEGQPQWNNEQEQATTERADKKEKRRGAAGAAAAAAASVSVSASASVCVPVADAKRE